MEMLPIVDDVYQGNEGLKLEFKSALKGIPLSTWDTYSAFANTKGGRIILGINDSTKRIEGVPKAELRTQELWNNLNNSEVVNRNILGEDSIWRYDIGDKTLIIIDVPQADRFLRPIYHRNMETGTFKRNGEGDYRCRLPEISSMLRDQSDTTYDATLMENTSFEDIDPDTLHAYRNNMASVNPDHGWLSLSDNEFAERVGAVGRKGSKRPLTAAGMLMFGKEYIIYRYFPNYKLDYREYGENGNAWTYRLVTGDGTWEGNVFNFFRNVSEKAGFLLDKPLAIGSDMRRIDDTEDRRALRECLLNSLIHADYMGDLTVKVIRNRDSVEISNSGIFRIPLETAKAGGESDPRNRTIAKMFSMIGLVERAGVGVNMICGTWERRYGLEPEITEDTENDVVTFRLQMSVPKGKADIDSRITSMMMGDPKISMNAISLKTGLSVSTVANHVRVLRESGKIRRVGGTRGHWEVGPL